MKFIEWYNNSPPGKKYSISLLQALIVGILVSALSLIDLKGIIINWKNIPAQSLGVFFYWEVAGILHTMIVFIFFTNSKELDGKLTSSERKWSIVFIVILSIASMGTYYQSLWHMGEHDYYYYMRESISYAPICIFFLTNLFFLIKHKCDKSKKQYFLKMILMLDLPFFIPYLLILLFAIYYIDNIESVHSYLVGVASTVLISSNFVTAAFNAYKETPASNN